MWSVSHVTYLLIKKCVGDIWYCYLIYFTDYIVFTLTSTLLIPRIFLILLPNQIKNFPVKKN